MDRRTCSYYMVKLAPLDTNRALTLLALKVALENGVLFNLLLKNGREFEN